MRKNLFTLLLSFIALATSFSVAKAQTQQSISLGDFSSTTVHFQGSIGQKAPFDFDYQYSRSQQLYTAEDLVGLEGKEITEIHFRVYNQEGTSFEPDYSIKVRLYLSNIEDTEFKKKGGERNYPWKSIDADADLCATATFNIDFDEKQEQDFELHVKLDKPFLYTGKSILMTVEGEANMPLAAMGQTYTDFYCYPKNVTGMPIRTLYKATDNKDHDPEGGWGEYSDGSGLKQRAVLKIFYRAKENEPIVEPLDPINPVVTLTAPGHLSEQLKGIAEPHKCQTLTIKGEMNAADVEFVSLRMGGLTKLDMKDASIQGNALPRTALSKHPNLEEVILPQSLTLIGEASLSDMPKLTRVVMGDNVTEIGMNAFALSRALSDVVWSTKLETIRSEAFLECKGLQRADLPGSVTTIEQNAFSKSGLVYFKTPELLEKIERMCFYSCSELKEVYLTEKVNSINFKSFGECTALTKVTSMNTTPPTVYRNAFDKVALATVILYVPTQDLVATYKEAAVWKTFGSIVPLASADVFHKLSYKNEYEGGTLKVYNGEELLPTEASVKENTMVRLVAEAKEAYLLKGWLINGREIEATGSEYTYEVKAPTTAEAIFAEAYKRYKVAFQANNPEYGKVTATIGGVEIESESMQKADQAVVFTAHPEKNYHLKHWIVNGTMTPKQGEATLEIVLNRQTLVEAVFERDEIYYQLSISIADNNGGVSATINHGTIPLNSKVKEGSVVEILAEPNDGYEFAFWTINGKVVEDTSNPISITIDKDYRVQASFKEETALNQVASTGSLNCKVVNGILRVVYPVAGATAIVYNSRGSVLAKRVVRDGEVCFSLAEGVYLVQIEGTQEVVKVLIR
ncbi:leucine-rich repeat protein [Porphyromonas endodontalis]|uniref:leucine-rich repeat protein n=1 Tax=Porphyromonas endodontalis TaxID=28124 RepID=UPI003C7C61FF